MKKNIILSIFALLAANIIYFIWMPYPKSFLKTVGNITFVFDLITNLIFFVIFALILLVSVNSVAKPGSFLTRKNILTAIAVCIAIQLGSDVLRFVFDRLLRWYAPLSNDFFTVLVLFVLALVTLKLLKVNDVNWKRFYAIFLPFAAIALAVFFVLDIQDILNVRHSADKFVYSLFDAELTHEANAIVTNTEFMYEIRNAFLDFLTCVVIMIALYFSTSSKNIEDDEKYHTKKAHFVTRIAAILLLSCVICGIKLLALPYNSLNIDFSVTSNAGTGFSLSDKTIIFQRSLNYQYSKNVYCKTFFNLNYENKHISDFCIDGKHGALSINVQGNQIIMENTWDKMNINGIEVTVCYDKAIAYFKNGVPYTLEIKNIADEEYDSILLEICEKFIEEKRILCFEYIGEYILKYDPDFIMPYIERYSAGDFTTEEIYQMGDIKPEYITKCAKALNNK